MPDPSLLETKKSKFSKATRKSNSASKKNIAKTIEKKKMEETNREVEGVPAVVEEVKGPFFIWNIPIMPEDVAKLDQQSKDVFMNVDRFNYKSGRTFREEASEFLAQKMEKKMVDQCQLSK